ncbi:MAG TPA: alkaline phosphatase PhoX [Thermoleophilaceae bacterium]|nr:alkaline phosphatase PhoX [Thermoleophilaceae bacterium]
MSNEVTRRKFVGGSAAAAAGITLGGPMSALAQRSRTGRHARAHGYGALRPTRELDSGEVYLDLPRGFKYRIISRQNDPMDDGNPTPGIFDGMAAFPGRHGSTILIRNHENRGLPGEIPVEVPVGKRYDPDANVRGGNTKLVVSRQREVLESYAVLGGTSTNCAGGRTPWRSWITCEEVFNYGSGPEGGPPGGGVPHGYMFEIDADADGPVEAVPIKAAGRFEHEATAWLHGVLYETEDKGDAAFYRFLPRRRPREAGDLASFGGTLQALVVKGKPRFDANSAKPGESHAVEWVTIPEPNPLEDNVRHQAQFLGGAIFDRTEGIWASDRRIYFDCTSGGEAQLGQLWELTPRGKDGGVLRLVYESTSAKDLANPDNLVIVPRTGDVFLQEDAAGVQHVRGVTRRGRIYDFARSALNTTEFCGGTFSRSGRTFFLNQQGYWTNEAGQPSSTPEPSLQAITYAIWGPFDYRLND